MNINDLAKWVVDTFDLRSNETFRKVVGTAVTVIALVAGLVQAFAAVLETVAP